MDTSIALKLESLRADYAAKVGRPFQYFYCPILFRDEETELCCAHVVNQAFRKSDRSWTVQRADVDTFFGSAFESDFVVLQERGKHHRLDVIASKDLSRKLQPKIKLDGKEIEFYRPTHPVPAMHSELILEAEHGTRTRLALKISPAELLASLERNWEVHIERDLQLSALVSLVKAAHLTMFEMLGYEYGLSAGGHFVGYDILGKFFMANVGLKISAIIANAEAFYPQFKNLVRPVSSAPEWLNGTASDRLLYLCTSSSGAWAFMVLVRAGEQLHAVLLPVMEDPDKAARYLSFLDHPTRHVEVRLTRFAGDKWEASPNQQTFIWPEASFE